MSHYRLYFIQKEHFTGVKVIDAESDDLALIEAESVCRGHEAELWCQGRRVKQLPPIVEHGGLQAIQRRDTGRDCTVNHHQARPVEKSMGNDRAGVRPSGGLIAIVDDDAAVRSSTTSVLERFGFRTQAFATGAEFLARTTGEQPVCILLDLHMPGGGGMAVLAALHQQGDLPPVIVVTGFGDMSIAIEAMKQGARDFIEKPYKVDQLLTSIRTVLDASGEARAAATFCSKATTAVASLTKRQRQVLQGILQGMPNKIIAYELSLSIRTIEAYRAQLLSKLGLHGTADAVRFALDAGLVNDPVHPGLAEMHAVKADANVRNGSKADVVDPSA